MTPPADPSGVPAFFDGARLTLARQLAGRLAVTLQIRPLADLDAPPHPLTNGTLKVALTRAAS